MSSPFEASTDYVKDALHDIAWSQTLSFFVFFFLIQFFVVSGIDVRKKVPKKKHLLSTSSWIAVIVTIEIQGPGRAGDLSAWDSTFGPRISKLKLNFGGETLVGDQVVFKQLVPSCVFAQL